MVRARLIATRLDDQDRVNVVLAIRDTPSALNELAKGLVTGLQTVYSLSRESDPADGAFLARLRELGWTAGWLITGADLQASGGGGAQ